MNLRTSIMMILALALGLGLLLWLLQSQDQLEAPTAGVQVVTSVYPLADFTRRIGGEFVSVNSVVPGGVEPHEFEPTPRMITQVLEADLLVYVGADFDAWAEGIAGEVRENGGQVLRAEDIVDFKASGEVDERTGELRAGVDPHVWLDPVRSQAIVTAIRDLLSQLDPEQASIYNANAQVFLEQLRELDTAYMTSLSQCDRNDIIVSHNAFGYLGDRYGFNIHAITGLSPEAEPSLNDLVQLAALARELDVDTVFFETLVSSELAETLAQEIGATTSVLNPIEGLSAVESTAGENYLSLMEANRLALAQALLCQ